jgi:hypothetical protein
MIEGTLRMHPSGQWTIACAGKMPIELARGDAFMIEVPGTDELQRTRMEFRQFTGPMTGRTLHGLGSEYHSVHGYHLTNGLRAAMK